MPPGRGFGGLWAANAFSNLADGLAFVSMPLLAASLTDDPRLVAGLATVYAAVRLLVAATAILPSLVGPADLDRANGRVSAAQPVVLVLFADERLGLDSTGYGLLLSASALGGLVGSAVTARVRAVFGYRWTIVTSLLLGAGSLAALSVTTHAVVAAVLLALYIMHAVVRGICSVSPRQRLVPEELRGRVNAAARVLALLGLALGSVVGGLLAAVDLAVPVAAGGAVFVGCAAVAAVALRRFV